MINAINLDRIHRDKKILNLIASISGAILLTFSSIDGNAANAVKGYLVDTTSEIYVAPNDNNVLDSTAVATDQNIKFLKDRVKNFSFFDVKTISRDDFTALHGDVLQRKGTGTLKVGDTISYTLYLPELIYIGDLPNIIKKINNNTFGDKLPDNASYIEIKRNIESAMIYILSLKNDKNKKQIQKEINRYYKLYQDFFPGENPIIDTTNTSDNIDKGTYYFKNSSLKETKDIKNRYPNIETDFLIKKIDRAVAENIYQHFIESFFEHGTELLSDIGTLKESMGLEQMKLDLEKIRVTGNKSAISKKEKEILNIIMKNVHNFGFITDNIKNVVFDTSIPSKILKTKEITCVGFSLLSHSILSDLGIKYNILYSPGHSLVDVELENGEHFLFDLLEYDKAVKYKEIGIEGEWQRISYNINGKTIEIKIIKGSDPEKMIIAQILLNKKNMIGGEDKESLMKQVYILNRAIKLSNKIPEVWYTLAYSQSKLGNYDQALIAINNTLKISPKDKISWSLKADICLKLNDYDGYIYSNNMYKKLSEQK